MPDSTMNYPSLPVDAVNQEQQQQFIERAKSLAPKYRTELLKEA